MMFINRRGLQLLMAYIRLLHEIIKICFQISRLREHTRYKKLVI